MDRDITLDELTPDGPARCQDGACDQTEDDCELIRCTLCRGRFCDLCLKMIGDGEFQERACFECRKKEEN